MNDINTLNPEHQKKILILYYSNNGKTAELARLISRGALMIDGVSTILRTVNKLHSKSDEPSNLRDPIVSLDDLNNCDALALGSPVRFGNMATELKAFFDDTIYEWLHGALVNKPATVFTSSSSMHGGQEACLLSMMLPLIHHGMIIIGVPYTVAALNYTESGGTPYGSSHTASNDNSNIITQDEKNIAIAQGKRLALITQSLNIHKQT